MPTAYMPFPDAENWSGSPMDFSVVDAKRQISEQLARESPAILVGARNIVTRMAAIETGAIEKLYENDRGFTINAAIQGAVLESLLKNNQQKKHALIASQIRAYDSVLDLVTGQLPIAQAWIRRLHEILCKDQNTFTAYTGDGTTQELPLPLGQYKTQENHVQTADGVHRYASVLETPDEMQRYVTNLTSIAYSALHPVDQAAYAHYALVSVHPFTDGNGRVARALTSIPTYRNYRVPILISVDHKTDYFDGLEAADNGDFAPLRIFMRDRIVESIDMLAQSVRAARAGDPREMGRRVSNLLVTRGGYTQLEIDAAGDGLLGALIHMAQKLVEDISKRSKGLQLTAVAVDANRSIDLPTHRRSLTTKVRMLQVQCVSSPPAQAGAVAQIGFAVPKNAQAADVFILEGGPKHSALNLELPVASVLPKLSLVAEMRLNMFAEEIISTLSSIVASNAREVLRKQGFDVE